MSNCVKRIGYPKCIGAAVFGDDRCTCEFPSRATKLETLEKRLAKVERAVRGALKERIGK